ncbi:Mu-like prophage major head subunit gpT family protein [Candidatus Pacearchaeota archaeon]|nr:Mu-like prophage major head subunit gpT family protein [Candidatus Pacearchaeota archaeon]
MATMLNEVMKDWDGYYAARRPKADPQYDIKLREMMALVEGSDGRPAHMREFMLKEAITTSDFPLMFADSLEREVLTKFKAIPKQMRQILRMGKVKDFRQVKRFRIDGATSRLNKVVEKGEYLATALTEEQYTYTLEKYGRQLDISWENIINDDLGAFNDIPDRLAHACSNTEEWFITNLYWAAAGPRAAFFSAANGGAAVGTAVLTIAALENAVEAMAAFVDPAGEPILNRPKYLVVGPALEFTARQILTSALKMWVEGTGANPTVHPTTNVIAKYGLQLIVNPWIPIVDTTTGATTWALFSDPKQIPAGEFGQLRGHENPQIHMKASDLIKVGGGSVSPFDGDFATDNVFYRVRQVMGGCTMDGQAGYASDGTV